MSAVIRSYYEQSKILPALINKKMDALKRNPDILKEFEYWVENHKYSEINCVTESGYTAKKLSELSEFLDGEAVFMLLIELRESPTRAASRIANGFQIK